MHHEAVPIVIDNGSGMMKGGLANYDHPSSIFSTIVGHPKYPNIMSGMDVGDDAQNRRGMLTLSYPMERDWENMERIWFQLLYNQLRAAPAEHPLFMTEAPFNPKYNREKMAQIMFESIHFNVPALYVADQASLALYSHGLTTGVVVDSGDGVTCVSPIYNGYLIPHAVQRMDLAGRDITEHLVRLLTGTGCYFNTTAERQTVRDIKEKICYVAPDFEMEMLAWPCLVERTNNQTYELFDGQTIDLDNERFRCTEAMFQPSFLGKESLGVHELVYNAIMKSDIDTRKQLWQNIVLSGGNTMFPGFSERLQKELERLAPPGTKVRVLASPNRKYSTWIGGAILAQQSSFRQNYITKQEYDETGPAVVHKKCFFR